MILLRDECKVGRCCKEKVSLVVDTAKKARTYVESFATGRTRRFECLYTRTDVGP